MAFTDSRVLVKGKREYPALYRVGMPSPPTLIIFVCRFPSFCCPYLLVDFSNLKEAACIFVSCGRVMWKGQSMYLCLVVVSCGRGRACVSVLWSYGLLLFAFLTALIYTLPRGRLQGQVYLCSSEPAFRKFLANPAGYVECNPHLTQAHQEKSGYYLDDYFSPSFLPKSIVWQCFISHLLPVPTQGINGNVSPCTVSERRPDPPMRLALAGADGSGCSTLCTYLCERYGLLRVEASEEFLEALASRGDCPASIPVQDWLAGKSQQQQRAEELKEQRKVSSAVHVLEF